VLEYKRYTFIQLTTDAHFPEAINKRRTQAGQLTPPVQGSWREQRSSGPYPNASAGPGSRPIA